jgi:ferritin-like metal-binding protein YciE
MEKETTMATTAMDHYHAWMRDAHALEKQALTLLDAQISRLGEDYPEVTARLRQHYSETEGQIEKLQSLMDRHDTSGSVFKDVTARVMGVTHALGSMMSSDEVAKDGLLSYGFEQTEIASYLCLIAAARTCGDEAAIPVYESILAEEQDMADWLKDHLPDLIQQFLMTADAEAGGDGVRMGSSALG